MSAVKLTTLSLLTFLFLSQVSFAEDQLMTGDEIRQEIIGQTLSATVMFITGRVIHREDGTCSFRASFRNAEGTWEIIGDEMYVDWEDKDEVENTGFIRKGKNKYKLTAGGPTLRIETKKPLS